MNLNPVLLSNSSSPKKGMIFKGNFSLYTPAATQRDGPFLWAYVGQEMLSYQGSWAQTQWDSRVTGIHLLSLF